MEKEKDHLDQKSRAEYSKKENQYNRKQNISEATIEEMKKKNKENKDQ